MHIRTPSQSTFSLLILALALVGHTTSASAQEAALPSAKPGEIGLAEDQLRSITEFLESEVDAGRIAGAVACVARHGRVGYLHAVGKSDLSSGRAMQVDALFRIASMTKPITSAAIMSLVEGGAVSLEAPISRYLPEFSDLRVLKSVDGDSTTTVAAEREPTIHDLLTHRSGFTYGWFGPQKLDAIYAENDIPDLFVPIRETLGDRVSRIADVPLKFQPGTAWDYGVSTDLLGRIVEVASGLTLEQFFRERFLRPLKMNDTHFYVPADKLERLSGLTTVDEQKQRLLAVTGTPVTAGFLKFSDDYCTSPDGRFFSGGGGLVSTASDYLQFLRMLLRGGELDGVRVLKRESVATMTSNQIGDLTIPFPGHGDGFGFGFGVVTDRGGGADEFSVGSFSWGGIFNTYFWVDPQEQLIGVLMTQVFPNDHLNTRSEFRRLAYAAIDDSGFERVYRYQPGEEFANPFFNGRQLRVNAPEVSIHPEFASRSEPRSSGMARIRIDEDLRKVRRVDLTAEVWGGHPGTANKRITINGRTTRLLPDVGTGAHNCTHQYPSFNLHPTDLVNGYNSLQFACDQGDTFWGHYIVDNVELRIGVNREDRQITEEGLSDFEPRVLAGSSPAGFKLKLALPEARQSAIAAVHYQARYTGYDENGNGRQTDWHGMTKEQRPYGWLGSSTDWPFELQWDTSMLPAQQRIEVRALVEFKDAENLRYWTKPLTGLTIQPHDGERVRLYQSTDLPQPFWSRNKNEKECTIDLDVAPDSLLAAELHVVAWTGGAGTVANYFTLNGEHLPIAEGEGHETVYSRLPIEPSLLQRGPNKIVLRSDTTHHGIEIMLPGPTLVVRYRDTTESTSPEDPIGDTTTLNQSPPNDQSRALEQFALTHPGDAKTGAQLFFNDNRTKCSVCHRVRNQGGSVGPELTKIGGKYDRPHLIDSLLYPSKQIGYGYETSHVLTVDGKVTTGVVKETDDTHITIVDATDRRTRIATADIEEATVSKTSIMPSGLADTLSAQELTDLVTYLETLSPTKSKMGGGISGPAQLPDGFEMTTIATGLSGATALEVAPDGRVFVCEQGGALRVVKDSVLLEQPFVTVPVEMNWERGLIGVTVAPDFPADPHVYVVYVTDQPYTHHRISRFRADQDVAEPGSEEILLRGDDQSKFGGNVPAGHQGGAIHFGHDGKLYVGIGEQTAKAPAQRMDALQGKILRLNPDGTIPSDNPFVQETTGKYRAIWAKGCRNPFTFALSKSGDMLINDVGGKLEEINRGIAGANYGWPTVDHGPTGRDDLADPIHTYPQSSINGGDFAETSTRWPKRFRNKYFFADFVQGWVRFIDPKQPETSNEFLSGIRRPVDLRFAPDGSLYVLLRNAWVVDDKYAGGTGSLVRIDYRGN